MTVKPHVSSQRQSKAGNAQPVLHRLLGEAIDCECNSSDKQQLKQWLSSRKCFGLSFDHTGLHLLT